MTAMTYQRRAWSVLLASFVACCLVTVGLPSTVLYVVNTASYVPKMTIRLQAGIVTAYCQGELERDAKVVGVQGRPLDEECNISVGADSESIAELTYELPPPRAVQFLRMQLYAGTRLRIDLARVPRFQLASSDPIFRFTIERGRVEWQTLSGTQIQPNIEVLSPHLSIRSEQPGAFALDIEGDVSRATVREGSAIVKGLTASSTNWPLSGGQQLSGTAVAIFEPTTVPPNIVRNGDFHMAVLDPNWEVHTATSDNSIPGSVEIINPIMDPVLDLRRVGDNLGWGRTGISQTLNVDVTSAKALRARLVFNIQEQQIDVCGSQGSECPMMIDLRYQRKDGSIGQWVQGFYAQGEALGGVLPDYMLSNRQSRHIYKPPRSLQTYVSENLLPTMPNVQKLMSIAVYAEGHSVHSQVKLVELTLE